MAKARLMRVVEAAPGSQAGRVTEVHEVVYVGPDVPNGFDVDLVKVENLDYSTQPAQIAAAIMTAVRSRAASLGITVGNNEVVGEGLVKG